MTEEERRIDEWDRKVCAWIFCEKKPTQNDVIQTALAKDKLAEIRSEPMP